MVRRYVTLRRTKGADYDSGPDAENYLARTVYETEVHPEPTGILDAHGNELFAISEMEPIGFIRWPSQYKD